MTDETTQLPVDQFIEDVIAAFRNEFNCVIVNDEPMNSGEILNEPIENFLINKLSLLQAKHSKELAAAKEAGAREAIRNMPIKELPSHLRLSDGTILTPSSSAYWDLIESQPKENQGDVG